MGKRLEVIVLSSPWMELRKSFTGTCGGNCINDAKVNVFFLLRKKQKESCNSAQRTRPVKL